MVAADGAVPLRPPVVLTRGRRRRTAAPFHSLLLFLDEDHLVARPGCVEDDRDGGEHVGGTARRVDARVQPALTVVVDQWRRLAVVGGETFLQRLRVVVRAPDQRLARLLKVHDNGRVTAE